MTRAKETPPGSGQMPDYKSPPSRLVHSLRKGYDNLRVRLEEKSETINDLRCKTRDLEESRKLWREDAKAKAIDLKQSQKALEDAKKRVEELEAQIKKNS